MGEVRPKAHRTPHVERSAREKKCHRRLRASLHLGAVQRKISHQQKAVAKRRLLALASEHTRGSSKRHSFQMRVGGKTQTRRLCRVRRESQPVTGSSLKRLNNSRAIMAATRSVIANGRRLRRVASRGSTAAVFFFTMKRLGWWEYRASYSAPPQQVPRRAKMTHH